MKTVKYISLFLGVNIFMFGFLKFFHPFSDWIAIQIDKSGLPDPAVYFAIFGELLTGIAFVIPFFPGYFKKHKVLLITAANATLVIMMSVAIYVHSQPNVPADVLPLKMKGPQIPLTFLLGAIVNQYLIFTKSHSKGIEQTVVKDKALL